MCILPDCEGPWTPCLNASLTVHKSSTFVATPEPIQVFSTSVKNISQSFPQHPSTEDQVARPYTYARQSILVDPCLRESVLHKGRNREHLSNSADCQKECRNSLQQKGSVQIRRPAFHPVQRPGNCTLPWPVNSSSVARASSHWQYVQESDADVAVDVDCCGDSGSMSKLCIMHPTASVRPKMSSPRDFGNTASAQGSKKYKTLSDVDTKGSQRDDCLPVATTPRMPHAGSELSEQQAQKEMAFRLNHARQTVEYVQRQAASFGRLDKGKLGIWEALWLVDSSQTQCAGDAHLVDEQHMSAVEHAMQTAELCRKASPHQDWFHLVGLIHGLGRLMALPRFGGQPEWAVSSESFPVGCRFSSSITCSHFFSVNPDRRRRLYSSATGMYQPNCGLAALSMSWSAYEYLYLVLLKNKTALPPVARFVLRYCNFLALTRPGDAYSEFLNSTDLAMMPWLHRFQAIQGSGQPSCHGQRVDAELRHYYDSLVLKYIPCSKLQF